MILHSLRVGLGVKPYSGFPPSFLVLCGSIVIVTTMMPMKKLWIYELRMERMKVIRLIQYPVVPWLVIELRSWGVFRSHVAAMLLD